MCSTWFDDILQEAGVDLYFVGHLHQYVRFVPNYGTKNLTDLASISPDGSQITNPQYTLTLIVGSPGNPEVQPSSCGGPTPENANYPTFRCTQNYGVSYMQAVNSTHAHVMWTTTVPIAGSPDPNFSDDFWLVVTNRTRGWGYGAASAMPPQSFPSTAARSLRGSA